MHRSGTSALTRVLNLLGCDLPKTPMGPSKGNEAGHWESQAICQLNDKLLHSAGSFWHDWQPFDPNRLKSPSAVEFRDEALTTLSSEFGASRLFVLKDPRICRLSALWLPILEKFDATPFVVLPLRNPLEVAASLAKRDGFDPSIGHLLWLRHVLDAERATRGRPRVFVSYDGLMNGWRKTIERIQTTLGLALPQPSDASAGEIEAFLSDALRHERATPASVTDDPNLSSWLRESFAVLDNWTRQGEKAADFTVLDRIGAAFDAAVPAFARPVEIGRQASRAQRRLEHELATARNQSAERADRLKTEAAAQAERLISEKRALEGRLKERFGEIAALTQLLEESEHEVRAARQSIAAVLEAGPATIFPLLSRSRWWNQLWVKHQAVALMRVGLFDPAWYLEKYPDVKSAGVDPAEHYVRYGAREGRLPRRR
jgi:hypothetical protein